MFYLKTHSTHFYLRLYGVRHMVKDHSDSEKGNPLPPHRLHLSINSKGSFICTIPQTVVEHWLEREIAQWVHTMEDRCNDPSHHERTLGQWLEWEICGTGVQKDSTHHSLCHTSRWGHWLEREIRGTGVQKDSTHHGLCHTSRWGHWLEWEIRGTGVERIACVPCRMRTK